jgi:hypothetical protein
VYEAHSLSAHRLLKPRPCFSCKSTLFGMSAFLTSPARQLCKVAKGSLKRAWIPCVRRTGKPFSVVFVVDCVCCCDRKSRALGDIIVSQSFSDTAKGSSKSPFSPSSKHPIKKHGSPATSEVSLQRSSPLKLSPLLPNRSLTPATQSS